MREDGASKILFTDIRIIDGNSLESYDGEVLVVDERIESVARAPHKVPRDGAQLVAGDGGTLMPGLTEAHAHLSFFNVKDVFDFVRMPVEENLLVAIENAKILLDHGFTSCFSAAAAKPRLDAVVRDAIDGGRISGPRLRAATQEMTPSGNLGDLDTLEVALPANVRFAVTCDSPHEFRAACRIAAREGVDTFKVNVSGDRDFWDWGAGTDATLITDEELAAVVEVARVRGKNVAAHAASAGSVKMCVKHGVDIVYHATMADEDALGMLESVKDRVFVAPALYMPYVAARGRTPWCGPRRSLSGSRGTRSRNDDGECRSVAPTRRSRSAWRRLSRLWHAARLPGARPRDVRQSVGLHTDGSDYCRHPPRRRALGLPDRLGQIKEGFLADILLVDGDPLADIAVLQNADRLPAIMKGGVFHKPPEPGAGRTPPRNG